MPNNRNTREKCWSSKNNGPDCSSMIELGWPRTFYFLYCFISLMTPSASESTSLFFPKNFTNSMLLGPIKYLHQISTQYSDQTSRKMTNLIGSESELILTSLWSDRRDNPSLPLQSSYNKLDMLELHCVSPLRSQLAQPSPDGILQH